MEKQWLLPFYGIKWNAVNINKRKNRIGVNVKWKIQDKIQDLNGEMQKR